MNREDLGELKNLYENVIYEQSLGSARERTQQQLELSRAQAAAAAAAKAANDARMAAIAQRKAPGNEKPGYSGPPTPGTTTAGGTPPVPTRVTPAKPGMSSPANATTAQKISGGMKVYDAQRKAGDLKGAAETGKNISSLKFGSPEERKAKTIGTRNPLMDKTFGYQTGNSPQQQQSRTNSIINSGKVAAINPQPEVQAKSNLPGGGYSTAATSMMSQRAKNILGTQQKPAQNPMTQANSYEWPSAKTIKDIADAYASIYEANKNDGNLANNYPPYDKVTRGDVIAGRLGKDEMGGKKKSTKKEDFELWIDSLLDEGYDLSDYTWDDMYEIYEQQLDEGLGSAIRRVFGGRKEPEVSPAPESRGAQLRRKYNVGPERSDTSAKRQILNRSLARAERDERDYGGSRYSKSVAQKSKEAHERYLRAGYSKYGVSDARGRGSKARRRAEGLQREDYAIYEIVSSYLLENNFAETINDANVIIENMSEVWLEEILNNN